MNKQMCVKCGKELSIQASYHELDLWCNECDIAYSSKSDMSMTGDEVRKIYRSERKLEWYKNMELV